MMSLKSISFSHELYKDIGLLIVRLGIGLTMMIFHGYGKLTRGPEGWERMGSQMQNLGIDFFPMFWGFMAMFSEFFCSLLLALGVLFRSRASSVRTWTRYLVGYADLDLGLRLSRQTVFTSIRKLFGGRDAEIGDQAFDSAFRVETDLPSKAKPFFTVTRRDSLRRLLATYPGIEVFDTEMLLERDRWERDALTIVSIVRRMVAAAKTLSGDVADTEPIDDALPQTLA